MIRSGLTEILSYFEDASFPVILLKPNLELEYMNRQANNKFGKYFKKNNWIKEYIKEDIIRKITKDILAGENVIVSPPDVKEFSFLLFQPILNKDQKTELVRLNIEILADVHKKYSKNSYNINLFDNIYNEMHRQLGTMEMSIDALKKCIYKDDGNTYIEMLNSSCKVFSKFVTTFDYIYSLMKSYNINETTLFNPKDIIDKIAEKDPDITAINLIGGFDVLVCNPKFFINTLQILIENLKLRSKDSKIILKAYDSKEHFVFVLQAEKGSTKESHYNYIQKFCLDLEPFKEKAQELGGNLISIENPPYIKILYSIRKHIRSEFTTEFNQDSHFGDLYKI